MVWNAMTRVRLIAIVALCVAALSLGCAKKTAPVTRVDPPLPAIEEPPPPAPPPPPAAVAPAPLVATLTEEEIFARKTLAELNAERPLGDAFFDLDAYSLREDARAVLQRNAEWLRRWPSTRITVEGHCDARGTGEYNLALGDRRATTVKDYLVSLGIAPDRVLVTSKGEESPVCMEQTESCWLQNRRGHPIITTK
jgi:peptidoglycan-associated lipoprotein